MRTMRYAEEHENDWREECLRDYLESHGICPVCRKKYRNCECEAEGGSK